MSYVARCLQITAHPGTESCTLDGSSFQPYCASAVALHMDAVLKLGVSSEKGLHPPALLEQVQLCILEQLLPAATSAPSQGLQVGLLLLLLAGTPHSTAWHRPQVGGCHAPRCAALLGSAP